MLKLVNKKYFPWIGMCIIFILFLLTLNTVDKQKKEQVTLKTELALKNQQYKVIKNELNESIVLQDVLVSNEERLVDSLIKEISWGKEKIKKKNIEIVIKEKLVTEIKDHYISIHDTTSLDSNYIKVPNIFYDSTKFYVVSGTVLYKGIMFNKLSFNNEIIHIVEKERYNMFYTKNVLKIHSNNPYTTLSKVQSIELKKEPNKFFKNAIKILIFSSGIFIGSKL